MIIEFVVNLLCELVVGLLNTANMLNIPTNGIQVLATFASYGGYIVGSDLLLTFCGCVCMWMGLKLSLGIFLFLWRLLPFT